MARLARIAAARTARPGRRPALKANRRPGWLVQRSARRQTAGRDGFTAPTDAELRSTARADSRSGRAAATVRRSLRSHLLGSFLRRAARAFVNSHPNAAQSVPDLKRTPGENELGGI